MAFVFDTIGGVLVAKVYNLFAKQKINPMIGAAGISAFPMSARVVNKMGLQEDNPELFADARRWGECIRSDRVRDCGRYDSDIVCLRCI